MPFPFANGVLLWGLLAASIPVIIHILNRRRVRTVAWGAMRFLRDAVISRRRRVKLEELLLLLLRTAILLFLALALARPFLVGGLFGAGGQNRDLVIVLDCSLSTDFRQGVRTSFDRELDVLRTSMENLREGDGVNVVLASEVPRALFPELTYDLKAARTAMDGLKPLRASLDMPGSLQLAADILAQGSSPLKQVVVITDGQRHGWFAESRTAWKGLAERVDLADVKPQFYVTTVGGAERPENLAVKRIALARQAVGTDRDVSFHVEIVNHSDVDISGRRLKLTVNGATRAEVELGTVAAHGSVLLPFTHQFEQTGPALITAELDEDALVADNVSYLGIEVLEELPVLLVEGDPGKSPAESELCFLRAALDPVDPDILKRKNLIASTVVQDDDAAWGDLLRFGTVVLANVKQLSVPQVSAIEQYVRSGGGLLVAPGDNVDRAFYNNTLYAEGRGLLPAALGEPVGDARSREVSVSLLTTGLTHRAVSMFRDPNRADISRARFYQHWQLERPTSDAVSIASFNDGTPFLIERDLDSGRVILMSTPVDADWSNFPLRPNYVTLMHELIYYLAAPVLPSRNLLVGGTLTVELDGPEGLLEVRVTSPDGRTRRATVVQRKGRWFAVYSHTDQGGLYKVEIIGTTGASAQRTPASGPVEGRVLTCAVNVTADESDLKPLDETDRGLLSARLASTEPGSTGMVFIDEPVALVNEVFAGSVRFELWRMLAALVVLMMLAEIAFTRKLSSRKTDRITLTTDDEMTRGTVRTGSAQAGALAGRTSGKAQ